MTCSLRRLGRASRTLLAAALVAAAFAGIPAQAIVPELVAREAGLTRAWHTQAAIDPATQEVAGATLDGGVVYLLSSAGKLQAIDAESGAPRWTRRLGDRLAPVAGPTVFDDRVALVAGSTAFVIDAATGAEVFSKRLDGAPGGSVAIDETHLLATLMTGRLVAHPLDYDTALPFSVASPGTVIGPPVIASGRVVWSTVEGMVYAAQSNGEGPSYRFDAAAPLSGAPIIDEQKVYFATTAGFVYSLETERGREAWRTAVEGSIAKPLVELTETIFVAAEAPSLYALGRATGELLWSVDGVSDFVAASEKRVYALAPGGALAVLDRETGRPVASWPSMGMLRAIPNSETDRLYLLGPTGALQCFHEVGADEPFLHSPAEPADEPAADASADEAANDATPDAPAEPIPGFGDQPGDADPINPFDDLGGGSTDEPADDGLGDPFDF